MASIIWVTRVNSQYNLQTILNVARTTMIDQAHYALRKHFADDMDEL